MQRKTNSTIRINGHSYDAATGGSLTPGVAPLAAASVHPAPKSAAHRPARHSGRDQHAHAPAPSHTLMRHAVKKPTVHPKKQHFAAQGPVNSLTEAPLASVGVKPSAKRFDEQRWRHAKHTPKSRLISHFSAAAADATPVSVSLPKPRQAAPSQTASRPAARPHADMLERAIQQARSHEQLPPPKPRRRSVKRKVGIGSAAALSCLLLGVVGLYNLPGARFEVASLRAGTDASVPRYLPTGYSLKQLNYGGGVVNAQFQGASGHYNLIQQRTIWNSTALRANFVATTDPNYQTVVADGQTVYLYDQTNATWVKDGTWYTIQSDGSLSNQQLIDLALSV